jgi:tRNA (cmo5U34)-methyltransferase
MGKHTDAIHTLEKPASENQSATDILAYQAKQPGTWAFDADVAANYDDMLERSVPQYATMREAVTMMATRFAEPQTTIVDLGCSLGGAMAPLLERLRGRNTFLGCDSSMPMLDIARERFADEIDNGSVAIQQLDLRTAYPDVVAGVTLAVLSLQFIPIERRQQLLRRIWQHTRPGGALIVVEKLLGSTSEIDDHLIDIYHKLQIDNRYSPEEIVQKQHELEGVLVPLTAQTNEEMLRAAGFTQVECFWRYMNFGAWIAIREPLPAIEQSTTHAIRGAVIVHENTPEAIHGATRELLMAIMERNSLEPANIVSAFFTVTSDLNAAFPAKAARQLGWHNVALICAQEIPVPGAMESCMRVLLHINTTRPRSAYRNVYLHGAERLLQDDCEPPKR